MGTFLLVYPHGRWLRGVGAGRASGGQEGWPEVAGPSPLIHKKQRRDVEPGPDFTPLCNFCCQTAVLSEEAFGMSQRPDLQALGLLDRRGILEKLCLV